MKNLDEVMNKQISVLLALIHTPSFPFDSVYTSMHVAREQKKKNEPETKRKQKIN